MSPPFMPLYVADYLAATLALTTQQHGAYMLLIMHYWSKGGLPDDDATLARIVRMTERDWQRNRSTLAEFFGDGWVHARVEAELSAATSKHARRVEAGKAGGLSSAMLQQCSSNAAPRAPPNEQQCSSNAQASSSEPEREEKTLVQSARSARPVGRRNFESEFRVWYDRFPRHEAKAAALKAFNRVRASGVSLEQLMAGAERYRAREIEPRYRKLPATWLNAGCWDDEAPSLPNGSPVLSISDLPDFQTVQELRRAAGITD